MTAEVESTAVSDEQLQKAQEALEAASSGIDSLPGHKQSRTEKKTRKALQKNNMAKVEGVMRVTMKRKQQIISMDRPDVYQIAGSDSYVIFGEARLEDPAQQAQQAAARAMSESGRLGAAGGASSFGGAAPSAPVSKIEEVEETGEVDETGLEADDINMVMQQANVSRGRAVKALREHNKDIVDAIMSLTQ